MNSYDCPTVLYNHLTLAISHGKLFTEANIKTRDNQGDTMSDENVFTYKVRLWLMNDEDWNVDVTGKADELVGRIDDNNYEKWEAINDLADYINEQVASWRDEIDVPGMFSDLLDSALAHVEYRQIADGIIEDTLTDRNFSRYSK